MVFNIDKFYTELNILLAEHNNVNIERFMLDQINMITNSVLIEQSCSTCGYGSFEGDNKICENDKEAKWFKERTYGMITVLNELACFYRDSGKLNNAIETFQKAEEEMDECGITDTWNYVQVVINKAGTYRLMGEYENALIEFERAEKVLNVMGDEDYYSYASLYNNTALIYQDLKDFNKAIEYLEKAVSFIRKLENKKDELAAGLSNLAAVYYNIKKYKEADAAIEESLLIFKELHNENNPHYAGALNTKAMFCYYAGDLRKAAEMFEAAIEKTEKLYGKNRDYLAGCRNCSYTYVKLGNKEKAQQYMKMAENAAHGMADNI